MLRTAVSSVEPWPLGRTDFFSSRRRHTRFDCDWSSDVCSSDLIALEMERAIARQHCAVMRPDSEDDAVTIGAVTSGTFSPTLGKSIALALTETGIVSTGDEVRVEVRERRIPARVVKRPFYAFAGGRR